MSQARFLIQRLARPMHQRFRGGKSELFLSLIPEHPGTLLDVGGDWDER
jgi:hypothetical protein